ncbi:hypothetical protein K1T71_000218 [Dendrolimus kikuchii]|uniref:Uncharacterized protein n=1 Tax=Dendrolimus kikuchii TaxID=765133 RepID=A0ACC1DIR0_9NEOP|nr:hypothetical protein K1T71_000218 [Dendrolimus kikuchii]
MLYTTGAGQTTESKQNLLIIFPVFLQWWQWLVQINNIDDFWLAQPTYIIAQAGYILAGLVTLLHAFNKGGRWPYFWLGTVLHGLYSDNFWHFVLPEYDNFWHSQTPVMLLGGRLPLHIILLYPAFMYHAAYAVYRLNLPKYAEPFAVGLLTILIDIPYDIVSVKFVHWTWHDTDPNIYDRHYWVPWNSYYFHATFAASFYYTFHASRKYFSPQVDQWTSANKKSEWISVAMATLLGMPGGVLMFIPIYHTLHDSFGIHSEVTFFLLFSIYAVFVLHGLLCLRENPKNKLHVFDYILIFQLAIHYIIYWTFVVFFNPENERSLGLHEPIGPCHEMITLTTPFGHKLSKRKYLCLEQYEEAYFDFHCVDQMPPIDNNWYLICGTKFENRAEYITILSTILFGAAVIFYGIYFQRAQVVEPQKALNKKKTK